VSYGRTLVLLVLKLGMVTFGRCLFHDILCSFSSIALHFLCLGVKAKDNSTPPCLSCFTALYVNDKV
jgi:hypothetical protein